VTGSTAAQFDVLVPESVARLSRELEDAVQRRASYLHNTIGIGALRRARDPAQRDLCEPLDLRRSRVGQGAGHEQAPARANATEALTLREAPELVISTARPSPASGRRSRVVRAPRPARIAPGWWVASGCEWLEGRDRRADTATPCGDG
jgi:hypothetical protein